MFLYKIEILTWWLNIWNVIRPGWS